MIQQTATVSRVPSDLNSPRAKLVYLYLSQHGEATTEELGENLDMKKITLYSIVETLQERQLIEEQADRYVLTADGKRV